MSVLKKFQILLRRKQFQSELEEEMAFHRNAAAQELQEEGVSPTAARRTANIRFGNTTRHIEASNQVVGFSIETVLQDLRFAIRQLRRNPGFAATAVLTLALGVAAAVTIFAFVDAALIKPLPYTQPSRLAQLFESNQTGPRFHLSYLDYLDWKHLNKVFSSIDIYSPEDFLLDAPGGVQHSQGAHVSDGFFRTLGVNPILGRDFHAGEDLPKAPRTALLSYSAWQNRFAAKPDVLGRTISLNGTLYTIIGVLPRDFHFAPARAAEFWVPIDTGGNCAKQRGCHDFYGVGRLNAGVTLPTALADMKSIALQLERVYPDTNRNRGANVLALSDVILGDIRPILIVLLAGAALLLLIACVNVASLLLVRSEGRRQEMALRGALGASRHRLIRQFITEGVLLVCAASSIGIALAFVVMHLLLKLIPVDRLMSMPYLAHIGLNLHVAVFASAIVVLAAAIFSLTPLVRLPLSGSQGLRDDSRGSGSTLWRRFGANLVILELSIATILLVGAGLLVQSSIRLLHVDTGLQPENLSMLRVAGPKARYGKDDQAIALERQVIDRLSHLPGVQSVTVSNDLPIGDGDGLSSVTIYGLPDDKEHEVNTREVGSNYFSTLGARLIKGRFFTDAEDSTRPRVAVVNQLLASRLFPGKEAIGQRILWNNNEKPFEIVGIVDDIKEGPLDVATRPVMYTSYLQIPDNNFYAIARTAQDPHDLLPALSQAIHQIDPGLGAFDEATMTDHIHDSPSAYLHRVSAWLVGGFAAVALLLGVVGLYGVVAFSVSRRTREIGMRMALGAPRASVYRLILTEAGHLAAGGIVLGLLGSLAAATLLQSLLFGIHSWDPATLLTVAALLGSATLLASYIPARRAASVNPVEALRAE
ncbi:duplicated orphan permease [Granulicella pectinivorans]|uniref:Duplicated orphan permease n=1 Tax=Granulicella pectinivorans TaxID=474950 RepID=A0A1I6MAF3_9BACT|nr:ABC transporter permease [Granulicella pectinivorans]SFS12700.1 duplicated orphan permease [Granulicella pectinivorans]